MKIKTILLLIPLLFLISCKHETPKEDEKHLIDFNIVNITDLSVGETLELKIEKIPNDAVEKIEYSLNDDSLAKIENNTLQALKDGKLTIDIKSSNNIKKTININISSIMINNNEVVGVKNKNIENLYVPSTFKGQNIYKIKQDALANLPYLNSVIIEEGIKEIEPYAFYNDEKLENITIPSTIEKVYKTSFEYCENLKYNIKDDIYYLGNNISPYLVLIKSNNQQSKIIITKETKIIIDYAFELNTTLENIELHDNIIHIGEFAFTECSSLKEIKIPNKITELAYNLFCHCENLETVILQEGLIKIGSYTFAYCPKLTNINIPSTVEKIAPYAFYSCVSIKKIVLPDSVTKIDVNGFYCCSGLEEITLSKNLEYIGNYAFYKCSSLKEIIIPDKITSISSYMFSYCKSLTKVVLPNNLEKINLQAFEHCTALTEIYISNKVEYIGDSVFLNCKSLTIYCELSEPSKTWEKTWNVSNCNVVWNYQK